jgi:hypothetical protein
MSEETQKVHPIPISLMIMVGMIGLGLVMLVVKLIIQ